MNNGTFLNGAFEFESQMKLWKIETIEDYDRLHYKKYNIRKLTPTELYNRIKERQNKAK